MLGVLGGAEISSCLIAVEAELRFALFPDEWLGEIRVEPETRPPR